MIKQAVEARERFNGKTGQEQPQGQSSGQKIYEVERCGDLGFCFLWVKRRKTEGKNVPLWEKMGAKCVHTNLNVPCVLSTEHEAAQPAVLMSYSG